MKTTLLREALRHAEEKRLNHPQINDGAYLHYSYVVLDGTIIGMGYNTSVEPPRYTGYHTKVDSGLPCKSHSEWNAWKRTRGLLCNRSFELINVRLTKAGIPRLSEPCRICANLLPDLGCTAFYYTNGIDGWSRLVAT
jgi:tRNA(Arg) A34 adenosine deaminase TadA